ncbi:hypothetical protein PTH_0859 [Pelotomaculum thermopropionicum SI]|uniref:Uncharacterized protein n=1 Tax=Pelotomaculum thermopropionicum (strain DSM 13744 / JCM 10971 / SI) TaxID=370438 RepID=A5D3Z7_PELTS|nr:hypothetical protein PTH_0859 [Pelotomaculum thermopropionicum SI]
MINEHELKDCLKDCLEIPEALVAMAVLADESPKINAAEVPSGLDSSDAGISVQFVTGLFFRPASPVEIHTEAQPPFCVQQRTLIEKISEEDVEAGKIKLDFEEFLGVYRPVTREILIYRRAINRFSKLLSIDAKYLEQIVRLHELCHAIVHLGVFRNEDRKYLDMMPVTDWSSFLEKRHSFFAAVDVETREFLAQLLTWHIINSRILEDSPTLEQAFLTLMQRQSPMYQFDHLLYRQGKNYLCRLLQLLWLCQREGGLFHLPKPECSGRAFLCRQVVEAYLKA